MSSGKPLITPSVPRPTALPCITTSVPRPTALPCITTSVPQAKQQSKEAHLALQRWHTVVMLMDGLDEEGGEEEEPAPAPASTSAGDVVGSAGGVVVRRQEFQVLQLLLWSIRQLPAQVHFLVRAPFARHR